MCRRFHSKDVAVQTKTIKFPVVTEREGLIVTFRVLRDTCDERSIRSTLRTSAPVEWCGTPPGFETRTVKVTDRVDRGAGKGEWGTQKKRSKHVYIRKTIESSLPIYHFTIVVCKPLMGDPRL